jgi:integrase/recombinase XerD
METRVHVLSDDRSGATSDAHLVTLWLAGRPESTQGVYRAVAEGFVASLPGGLVPATVADVVAWASKLDGEPTTVARKLYTVKSLLSFAHRTGYLAFDVGRAIRGPKLRSKLHERIVEAPVVRDVIATAAPGRDRALVRFMYASGCRLSEALGLRWVDITGCRVTLNGKGGRTRTVLVPQAIADELLTLRWKRDDDRSPVFKSYQGRPLSRQFAGRVVAAVADRLGIDLSPHWLRHCHASHALDNGAPIHLVQRDLGHASVATTSKYLHARPTDGSARFVPA